MNDPAKEVDLEYEEDERVDLIEERDSSGELIDEVYTGLKNERRFRKTIV